jgi:hypothetical protein
MALVSALMQALCLARLLLSIKATILYLVLTRCEPVIEYALKCLGMEGVPSAIDQRTLLGVNLCIVALVGMDGVVLSRQAFPGE